MSEIKKWKYTEESIQKYVQYLRTFELKCDKPVGAVHTMDSNEDDFEEVEKLLKKGDKVRCRQEEQDELSYGYFLGYHGGKYQFRVKPIGFGHPLGFSECEHYNWTEKDLFKQFEKAVEK